jgi:hypothetical protein
MESNLKIEAKDINLDLNKLVNKENLFKIEKTNLNNPHISIILPKSIQTKDEIEKSDLKKKESDKEVENKKTKRVNFGPINIKNMTLDFEDKNLPIPFKTTISKLTGEVSAVKNRANSTSNLEINGVVDLSKKASSKIDCNLCEVTMRVVYKPTKEEQKYKRL